MAGATVTSRARGSEDAASRPRPETAKCGQILDGARKVFLADGFDGASMNEIARVAGVSKGTLYVYFDSKEELFAALIRDEKRQQAEQLCRVETGGGIRAALVGLGERLLELVLRPSSIAHFRTVLAVAAKFPSVGRAFYEAGPEFGRKRLAAYLDTQVAAGVIEADDTETAAVQFIEMCKSPYQLQACLNVGTRPSEAEIRAHVGKAVDVFLRAYAPRA